MTDNSSNSDYAALNTPVDRRGSGPLLEASPRSSNRVRSALKEAREQSARLVREEVAQALLSAAEQETREDSRQEHQDVENGKTRSKRLSSVVIDIDKTVLDAEDAVDIAFSDIKVTVQKKGDNKKIVEVSILNSVWGAFPRGELVGIMGSSGAGKTTLLNTLSGRLLSSSGLRYTGSITDNGRSIVPRDLRRMAAYVRQDDVLLETLTVRETLYFAAKLKLPRHWPDRRRRRMVDYIIEELGLIKCADTQIGNTEKRGISGGERKRVSIGVELITNPKIIFLDEPTSGLDSFTAASVMGLLQRLASAGRTVICTIHQPSSEIYLRMDKLLLLSKGHTIFFGPPEDAISHFSELGYHCPEFMNPADFCVEVAHVDMDNQMDIRNPEHEKKVQKLVDAMQPPKDHPSLRTDLTVDPNSNVKIKQSLPPCAEFPVLMWRSWLHFIRTPFVTRARLFQTVFVALLVGLLYLQIGYGQASVQNREGALFFSISSVIMTAVQAAVLTFPAEKPLFLHEQDNFMYRPSSYFWGKTFVEFPSQVLFPTIFFGISYFLVGFQLELDKIVMYLLTLILLANAGNSLGLMLGCIVPNAEAATSISTVTIIPFMLFSGKFANTSAFIANNKTDSRVQAYSFK